MAFDPCPSCGSAWYASHYASCDAAAAKFVKELGAETYWQISDNYPRCPKCGKGCQDWHEFVPRFAGDGDSFSVQCPECEHEYRVEMVINHSFRIRPDAA